MSIAEKLIRQKQDFDDVYEAGKASMIDESKIVEKTVYGSSIHLNDVSEIPHKVSIKGIKSKNLIPFPYLNTTSTINGITFVDNGDGSITVSGETTTKSALFVISRDVKLTAGTYVVSGGIKGVVGIPVRKKPDVGWLDTGKSGTFSNEDEINYIGIYVHPNQVINEPITIYPQLEEGTTATPWRPYVADIEGVKVSVDGKIYTLQADGTIAEDIPSISPYMNVSTDTAGVDIELTYRKSWGMQTSYDRFWDDFQQKGSRMSYQYAFETWSDALFYPKYDMILTSAVGMFTSCNITNLKQRFIDCGVVLDTSKISNFSYMFAYSRSITHIPTLNVGQATTLYYTFQNCSALEEIRLEGVLGQSIDFKHSTKLSHDSIVSIINALSTTTSEIAVTLSKTAVNTAFETSAGAGDGSTSEEWLALTNTKTNWTINLV